MLRRFLTRTKCLNNPIYCFSQAKITAPVAQKPGSGQTQNVTVIPGTGVGPEITGAVMRILDSAFVPIKWDVVNDFTLDQLEKSGCSSHLKKNDILLLGTLPEKSKERYSDPYRLYKELDTFANLTYIRTLPNVKQRHNNFDIAVIRENTEGEYSGVEHEVYPGVVESIKIITKKASDRIANYAFEFAYVSRRKKVTAVHKANIMKLCDGLFLQSCKEAAKKYPNIEYEEIIIDNCCMQLIKNPSRFDVMVMPNLYGSIVSNTLAGLCGGPGVTSGANIGDKYAIFEQGTRHTGLEVNGKIVGNPTGLLLSAVMMLKHLGLAKFAVDIERALERTYLDGKVRTRDLGGDASVDQFADEIIRNLKTPEN